MARASTAKDTKAEVQPRAPQPKSAWRGAVSLGLVTIPVKLVLATEDRTVKFHQLHQKDNGRIRNPRRCEKCNEEVSMDEVISGYEYTKNVNIPITEEEKQSVRPEASDYIEILEFVPNVIDPVMLQKPYYIVPDSTGIRAYALLRRVMDDERVVAVARVSFTDKKQYLCVIWNSVDNCLMLHTMVWPDEVRNPALPEIEKEIEFREEELRMAGQLVSSMTRDTFDPERYRNTFREAMLELIEAKAHGQKLDEKPEVDIRERAASLMEALKQSVDATKQPARKRTTRKTPAKRTRRKAS